MKKLLFVIIFVFTLFDTVLAKKDINAWKNENEINDQYQVFKQNLNYWAGNYILSGAQLDEFYGACTDTISNLESELHERILEIGKQNDNLAKQQALVKSTQEELENSQNLQNSITVFGMNINKHVYSVSMYLFILGVLVFAGIIYFMYQKSLKTTRRTRKELDELKQEYEEHKKSALDRYTKINMELHKTRLELQKK